METPVYPETESWNHRLRSNINVMSYIPNDAEWYLADLIIQMRVEMDPRSIVHINTILVRADSPEDAHEKALLLGKHEEGSYVNSDGKTVSVVFCGLGELNVVHDKLEHGSELLYRERVDMSDEQVRALAKPKGELAVFAPRQMSTGPNYMPKSVMDQLKSCGIDVSDIQMDSP